MRMRGPNNVGRAVQTGPTLLRYASAMSEQKRCFELLAHKFDQFQTLRNSSQEHSTTCIRVCKWMRHATSNNVASVCSGLYDLQQNLFRLMIDEAFVSGDKRM